MKDDNSTSGDKDEGLDSTKEAIKSNPNESAQTEQPNISTLEHFEVVGHNYGQ